MFFAFGKPRKKVFHALVGQASNLCKQVEDFNIKRRIIHRQFNSQDQSFQDLTCHPGGVEIPLPKSDAA